MDHSAPVQIGLDNNWEQVSSGLDYTVGIKHDGTLWAWGWNVKQEVFRKT